MRFLVVNSSFSKTFGFISPPVWLHCLHFFKCTQRYWFYCFVWINIHDGFPRAKRRFSKPQTEVEIDESLLSLERPLEQLNTVQWFEGEMHSQASQG